MNRGAMLAYKKAGALFPEDGDPLRASRPFDEARAGFVPGEGGAFFLLEEQEQAVKARCPDLWRDLRFWRVPDGVQHDRARPRGPLGGGGPAGRPSAKRDCCPAQIDVVAAHGTGTHPQ